MEKVKGVILYEIEMDGCLNGVYTNNVADGIIFNEIAKIQSSNGNDDIEGIYNCSYIEVNPLRNNAILKIEIAEQSHTSRTYSFQWTVEKRILFNGIGYRMNPRQLVVHYWDNSENVKPGLFSFDWLWNRKKELKPV